MRNYIFCSVQRSGKTWIVDTLRRLGLGHGLELLTEFERGRAPEQEQLAEAFVTGGMRGMLHRFSECSDRAGFPCVGISLQWSNFHGVAPETIARITDIQSALAPSEVYLIKRRDVLGQAISHLLMVESGYAHSTEPSELRERRNSVAYDRDLLERSLRHIRGSYAGWRDLLKAAEIRPSMLCYEDFVDDPQKAFGNLAEQISGTRFTPTEISTASGGLRKISDSTDEAFRNLYLEKHGDKKG